MRNWQAQWHIWPGFSGISDDGVPTHLQSLTSSGILREDIFAFYLGTGGTGELVVGGADPAHYNGEFRHLPVQNQSLTE